VSLVICTRTFVAGTPTGSVVVHRGEALEANDPIAAAYPTLFANPDDWAANNVKRRVRFGAAAVEAATAAPGEKRTVTKPTKPKK
jgi:hypothetical protein